MRFGSWVPLEEAVPLAPAAPGLFQLRLRDGLLPFPRGKSAMVAYGAGPDVRAALSAFLEGEAAARARALGPLLCRFAEPDGERSPAEAVALLRRRFVDQFGAPPFAEAPGGPGIPA